LCLASEMEELTGMNFCQRQWTTTREPSKTPTSSWRVLAGAAPLAAFTLSSSGVERGSKSPKLSAKNGGLRILFCPKPGQRIYSSRGTGNGRKKCPRLAAFFGTSKPPRPPVGPLKRSKSPQNPPGCNARPTTDCPARSSLSASVPHSLCMTGRAVQ